MEDYDEDYEDEDNSGGLILSMGDDGKTSIETEKDYETKVNNQSDLTTEFIRNNLDKFKEFLNSKGISEKDFNNGLISKD